MASLKKIDTAYTQLLKQALRVAALLVFIVLVLLLAIHLVGCCHDCPVAGPPKVIVIDKPCSLPPIPRLPEPARLGAMECPRPAVACFDVENGLRLIQRDQVMRQWIKETVTRCAATFDAKVAVPRDGGVDGHGG